MVLVNTEDTETSTVAWLKEKEADMPDPVFPFDEQVANARDCIKDIGALLNLSGALQDAAFAAHEAQAALSDHERTGEEFAGHFISRSIETLTGLDRDTARALHWTRLQLKTAAYMANHTTDHSVIVTDKDQGGEHDNIVGFKGLKALNDELAEFGFDFALIGGRNTEMELEG